MPSELNVMAAGGARREQGPGWIALIPALVTLGVTLYRIQRPSYNRDEAATLLAVHRSFPELLRMLGNTDVVHGAYYALMWVITRLAGSSEFATRFPSAVGMAVAAGGVTLIGRRLISGRAGLAGGLVFAVLPSVTWYAGIAREYAIVTALATVASYLFLRVLDAGGTRWRWPVAYGAALAAMGLGNFFSLLIIPAHAVTLTAWARNNRGVARRVVVGWLSAAAVAVAVVSPVIVAGYAQRYQIQWIKWQGMRGVVGLTELVGTPPEFFMLAAVTVGGLLTSAARGRSVLRADWPGRLLALALPWLLVPGALLFAVSLVHPVYTFRYIVFCIPALALLAGAALTALSRAVGPPALGWVVAAAALALIAGAGMPTQIGERGPAGRDYSIRGADQIVARSAHPGDALLNLSYWPMSQGGGVERLLEAPYSFGLARLHDVSRGAAPVPSASPGGTFAPEAVIRQRLATVTRLWVASWNYRQPPGVASWSRTPEKYLHSLGFTRSRTWHLHRVWLWLYIRHPGATSGLG